MAGTCRKRTDNAKFIKLMNKISRIIRALNRSNRLIDDTSLEIESGYQVYNEDNQQLNCMRQMDLNFRRNPRAIQYAQRILRNLHYIATTMGEHHMDLERYRRRHERIENELRVHYERMYFMFQSYLYPLS